MLFHPYRKDVSNVVPVLKINQNERVDKFDFIGVTFDEPKYSGILNKLKLLATLHSANSLF